MTAAMENAVPESPAEPTPDAGPWLTSLGKDGTPIKCSPNEFPADTLGLAISGGGIRSATFALGIIQSLARSDWLRRIDLLSTVSGGGYIGTFLGRYFDQLRHTLSPGPGGAYAAHRIVANSLQDPQSAEVRWLRKQSNYLAPNGSGDQLFNLAAFWRNFLSLHFVLGMLFLGILGVMNAASYGHWLHLDDPGQATLLKLMTPITTAINPDVAVSWWIILELVVWLVLFPLAFAYWLVSQDRHESMVIAVLLSYLLVAVSATLGTGSALPLSIFSATVFWMVLAWHEIRRQIGSANSNSQNRLLLSRNLLTTNLAMATALVLAITTMGVVNWLGQSLAGLLIRDELTWPNVLARFSLLAAPMLAAAPLLRIIASFLSGRDAQSDSLIDTIAKIPYLMNLVMFFVGAVVPLSLVAFLSHAAYGNGGNYLLGVGVTVLALLLSLILGCREALPFVNRSGPLAVYAARLSRVFLGAVNPARKRQAKGGDVTTVIEGDDVPFDQYKPHLAGGPLHLVNVAINETVDVASQRGLRDRQAENMAIGPVGLSIAHRWHALWGQTVDNRIQVTPITNGAEIHPFVAADGSEVRVERLSIRIWMAISGAAVSPGSGRYTGAAFSLLVTLANLRLGYWWDSGLAASERALLPFARTKVEWLKRLCFQLLAAQSLLVSELRGRFGGPWLRYFYLSDGGNFENSGVYELLRRRVPYIIAIDGTQDKLQQGTGLGELVRIARIDFGCEFEEASKDKPAAQKLGISDKAAAVLGSISDLITTDSTGNAKSHATLLRVSYTDRHDLSGWGNRKQSWLLYIRLTMTGDEPADVKNYRATNPDFPNQSTLDQDFDEPQWESYRRLGQHIGDQLF